MIQRLLLLLLFFSGTAFAEIDCNRLDAFPATEKECNQCPNRTIGIDKISFVWTVKQQRVCHLKECPDGTFFDARHKNCLPCDYDGEKVSTPSITVTDRNENVTVSFEVEYHDIPCLNVSAQECAKCPNRRMDQSQCILSKKWQCPAEKPVMSKWGGFEDSCGYTCEACKDIKTSFSAEDCSICPGFEKNETGLCVSTTVEEGYFVSSNGILQECSNTYAEKASEKECARCPNRILKDGFCILKECPKETDIRILKGSCWDADSIDIDKFRATEEECRNAKNHIWFDNWCVLPQEGKYFYFYGDKQQYGDFAPCDETPARVSSEVWCNACPNRMIIKDPIGRGMMCALKECPASEPLRSTDFDCYHCNSPQSVYASREKCLECPNRTWNDGECFWNGSCIDGSMLVNILEKKRDIEDGYVDFVQQTFYECVLCNDEFVYATTEEECAKCPNREYKNGFCEFK